MTGHHCHTRAPELPIHASRSVRAIALASAAPDQGNRRYLDPTDALVTVRPATGPRRQTPQPSRALVTARPTTGPQLPNAVRSGPSRSELPICVRGEIREAPITSAHIHLG